LVYFGLSKEERLKLWDDGVHFTQAGYQMMANIVFEGLKPILLHM